MITKSDQNSLAREGRLLDNPLVSREELDMLALSNHPEIRFRVACHPNTSNETLKKLSGLYKEERGL